MSMTYRVDAPAVLKTLKGGDRITATVYEGDTSKLYKVRIAASPTKQTRERAAADFLRLPVARRRELRRRQARQVSEIGAELQAVRLDIAYKCLKTSYIRENPGACPMDRSDLVPVTASIFWLCKNDPDREKHYLEPGTCGDGSPREKAFEVRPHGDHNPRHGGPSVFMSEDLYHHVEATLVAPTKNPAGDLPRVLLRRIHAADQGDRRVGAGGAGGQERQSRPAAPVAARPVAHQGRQRDGGAPAERRRAERERAGVLRAACEAQAERQGLADRSHVHVLLKGARAHPFRRRDQHRSPGHDRKHRRTGPGIARARFGVGRPRSVGNVLDPLPETKQDLLAELQKNMDSVTKQWQTGNLSGLWYPALRAKDVALKLQQDHGNDISDDRQRGADERRAAGDAVRVADRFGRRPRKQGKDRGALRRVPQRRRRRFLDCMAPRH